jgi:hypothetical protein
MRIRSVLSHSAQAVLEGALIAILVVGLVAGTAFAARGGAHSTSGSSATVTVNPDPVDVGAQYTVSGCGYKAGTPLDIKLYTSTATVVLMTGGDANGCFSADNTIWSPSSVRVEVWQYGRKWSLKATTTFTVR